MPRSRITIDSSEPDEVIKPSASEVVAEEKALASDKEELEVTEGDVSATETPDKETISEEELEESVIPNDDTKPLDDPETDAELRKQSKKSTFSTFVAFPTNIHFAAELPGDVIILILRAHPITNIPWLLIAILAALVPFVVLPILTLTNFIPLAPSVALYLTLLWYMGVFSYSFLQILYWYFNVGIITNQQVVDIDWNSLTHRDITNSLITKIEDVKFVQMGVLPGVFDFGTVHVQTAGTDPNIEFANVQHPALVVRKIQELMLEESQRKDT